MSVVKRIKLSGVSRDNGPRLVVSEGRGLRSFPVHSHEFVELVVIYEGTGIHVVNGREVRLSAGDVFVVQGDHTHGFTELVGVGLINVMYDPADVLPGRGVLQSMPGYQALFMLEPYLRSTTEFHNCLRLDAGPLNWAVTLARRMDGELKGGRPGWTEMARALLAELVIFLSRCREERPGGDDERLYRTARIVAFMDEHLADDLDLPALAAKANMSVNTFLRVFKAATGASPMQYLNRLRIDAAKQLLAGPRKSITEIASRCGFPDSNYFTRRFRAATGVSPRDYRDVPPALGGVTVP